MAQQCPICSNPCPTPVDGGVRCENCGMTSESKAEPTPQPQPQEGAAISHKGQFGDVVQELRPVLTRDQKREIAKVALDSIYELRKTLSTHMMPDDPEFLASVIAVGKGAGAGDGSIVLAPGIKAGPGMVVINIQWLLRVLDGSVTW